ncbi:unnamed protein product [Vitrella brassicaformis CCMP3155]|uniref:polyribonucleotide nucleotidyltransferase n=3 Tax=Vitrella brassicaformis TaxID=1169539 RepID=A0A0G4GIA3_VITBC|nr:unnamed protein product [Vitrella brassicaformis CCMP3155]|eukprot:CEM29576.1 unnamed protein product [Vitrella brassicaformis CCMP3155]
MKPMGSSSWRLVHFVCALGALVDLASALRRGSGDAAGFAHPLVSEGLQRLQQPLTSRLRSAPFSVSTDVSPESVQSHDDATTESDLPFSVPHSEPGESYWEVLPSAAQTVHRQTIEKYGDYDVILETGNVARQAAGSVMVRMGDCVVLSAVTVSERDTDKDFFPLRVDYVEKVYSAGRIPGGWTKREMSQQDPEILIGRLIDRPIRPLFPKWFKREVQIVTTLLSYDENVDPAIPALLGASAALTLAGVPFQRPLGAARVGYVDGEYVLNPTAAEDDISGLDLTVAGTSEAIMMVEAQANELTEEVVLGGILYGHEQARRAIEAIQQLADKAGRNTAFTQMTPPPDQESRRLPLGLDATIDHLADAIVRTGDKGGRAELTKDAEAQLRAACDDPEMMHVVTGMLESRVKERMRQRVLSEGVRVDGRGLKEVRSIACSVGLLPRVHGSALFTRGGTQSLSTVTLGGDRDAKQIDDVRSDRLPFILHYNFPPYSVNEIGFLGRPKRRDIGHGWLARRALQTLMPSEFAFPYTVRVVSEITESDGSSSMATVCASSLALMDAGVPLSKPVAGVAMGLIKDPNGPLFAVLTDIMGFEDALGDMDFKVAGTTEGITALQMDIKIGGIDGSVLKEALAQAREGRMHILNEMSATIAEPRTSLSPWAPQIFTHQIKPSQMGDVIGRGGERVRQLEEDYSVKITVSDDGLVQILAEDPRKGREVLEYIKGITDETPIPLGTRFDNAQVVQVAPAFVIVKLNEFREGFLHVSETPEGDSFVPNLGAVYPVGNNLTVWVKEVQENGRLRVTAREETGALLEQAQGSEEEIQKLLSELQTKKGAGARQAPIRIDYKVGDEVKGAMVDRIFPKHAILKLPGADRAGLLPIGKIANEYVPNVRDYFKEGQEVRVWVDDLAPGKRSIIVTAIPPPPDSTPDGHDDYEKAPTPSPLFELRSGSLDSLLDEAYADLERSKSQGAKPRRDKGGGRGKPRLAPVDTLVGEGGGEEGNQQDVKR